MEMTLGEAFARSARKFPKKVACMDDERSLTYEQLNREVNRWAHAIRRLGVIKGARVATLSNNCIYLMAVYLAHLKQGIVTTPLNSRATLEELCHQAEFSDSDILVFHSDFTGQAEEIRDCVHQIKTFVCMGGKAPGFSMDYKGLLEKGSEEEPFTDVEEEDEAFHIFTGGTTGAPKGAILTHKNLMWSIISVTTENHSPTPEDKVFYPFQMYHTSGMHRFLAYMYAGGTFIGSKTFDPEKYLDVVEKERTTFISGNPTIFQMLLEVNKRHPRDTSSMKRWLCSMGFLHQDLKSEIDKYLWPNGELYGSYGLTEASPPVTVLKPWEKPRRWGSVGRPYMCTEVRIVDEQDRDLSIGEEGEIVVSGPTVFKGYYKEPEETERVLRGGWLHTGDIGKYDDLGYLYMVDRLKDMIKTGGLNVYSKELEDVLSLHPDIAEAAVIGVPDPKWGESIRAIVVQKKDSVITKETVINHCRQHLASYKKPTSVVFVDELPKGSFGGKTLKKLLREKYGKQ